MSERAEPEEEALRRRARASYRQAEEGEEPMVANADSTEAPLFVLGGRPGFAFRTVEVCAAAGPSQPVYGLQPPRMDWRPAGVSTILAMAAHYLGQVRAIQPTGPYRLLGASFGGLIAFELALQLERAGEEVSFLALIDTTPAVCSWESMASAAGAATELEGLELGPDAGPRSAAAEVHTAARAAHRMAERARCELTFFLCAGEGVHAQGDRRGLWGQATSGGMRLLELPGLHARFDAEPQFSALRDGLRSCLAGEKPAGRDAVEVFGAAYRLEGAPGAEVVSEQRTGSAFPVEWTMRGRVGSVRPSRARLIVRGWAGDSELSRGGYRVVAFLDGRYAGYSTPGFPTPRLARRRSSPGLAYAGFRMRLPARGTSRANLRVFALSPDGRAGELGTPK